MKEDFIDKRAVSSIKEKLPHVMPVSCYRLGIDGANIVFQSKVSVFIFTTVQSRPRYKENCRDAEYYYWIRLRNNL